jgi:hypothetical protein
MHLQPYMKTLSIGFLSLRGLGGVADTFAVNSTDLTGRWKVTTFYPGGSSVAG